jgi:hypothetical protein
MAQVRYNVKVSEKPSESLYHAVVESLTNHPSGDLREKKELTSIDKLKAEFDIYKRNNDLDGKNSDYVEGVDSDVSKLIMFLFTKGIILQIHNTGKGDKRSLDYSGPAGEGFDYGDKSTGIIIHLHEDGEDTNRMYRLYEIETESDGGRRKSKKRRRRKSRKNTNKHKTHTRRRKR